MKETTMRTDGMCRPVGCNVLFWALAAMLVVGLGASIHGIAGVKGWLPSSAVLLGSFVLMNAAEVTQQRRPRWMANFMLMFGLPILGTSVILAIVGIQHLGTRERKRGTVSRKRTTAEGGAKRFLLVVSS